MKNLLFKFTFTISILTLLFSCSNQDNRENIIKEVEIKKYFLDNEEIERLTNKNEPLFLNYWVGMTKKVVAKSAIRLAVKKELKGIVPFSELDNLLKEVIEQAEGQFKDWPMVG